MLFLTIVLVFLLSFSGLSIYPTIALKYKIQAVPNYRTLHVGIIPRGGGVVLALASMIGFLLLQQFNVIDSKDFIVLFCGCSIGVVVGFADDVFELNALFRLVVQLFLAILIIYYGYNISGYALAALPVFIWVVFSFIGLFLIVWFFNLFNFIDGIDGLTASLLLYIGGVIGTISVLEQNYSTTFLIAQIIMTAFAFLLFNWPPAKIFLGDAGTWFFGFFLAFLMVSTVVKGQVSIFIWLIVMAYVLSDTTLTTLTRFFMTPKWYKPHRSHAYQNLARVWNSHFKVLTLIMALNCFWLTPLAFLSWLYPEQAILFLILAYLPITIFVVKFGPLYQDQ